MFDFPTTPATGTVVTVPDGSYRVWDSQKWRAAPSANTIIPPVNPVPPGGVYSIALSGAVGDGVHDDQPAIQAWLNTLPNGAEVTMPPGGWYYIHAAPLVIPPHIVIRGAYNSRDNQTAGGSFLACGGFYIDPALPAGIILCAVSSLRNVKVYRAGMAAHVSDAQAMTDYAAWATEGVYRKVTQHASTDTVIPMSNTAGISVGMVVTGVSTLAPAVGGAWSPITVSAINPNVSVTLSAAIGAATTSRAGRFLRFGSSIGVMIARGSGFVTVDDCCIVGFRTGFQTTTSEYSFKRNIGDCITNVEVAGGGDTAWIQDCEWLPLYGANPATNYARQGDMVFAHDAAGTRFINCFGIGWQTGWHFENSNVQCTDCMNEMTRGAGPNSENWVIRGGTGVALKGCHAQAGSIGFHLDAVNNYMLEACTSYGSQLTLGNNVAHVYVENVRQLLPQTTPPLTNLFGHMAGSIVGLKTYGGYYSDDPATPGVDYVPNKVPVVFNQTTDPTGNGADGKGLINGCQLLGHYIQDIANPPVAPWVSGSMPYSESPSFQQGVVYPTTLRVTGGYTVALAYQSGVIFDAAGTLATHTIELPPFPVDGQTFDVWFNVAVTTLTFASASQRTTPSPPGSVPVSVTYTPQLIGRYNNPGAGQSVRAVYELASNTWYFGGGTSSALPATTSIIATGGTASRTLADRFGQIIDIRDLGAVCDGTTDDTAAWTAAFAKPDGTVIRIPQNCVTIVGDGFFRAGVRSISVIGDGRDSIIRLKTGTTLTHDLFIWAGGNNVKVENLTLDFNNCPQPGAITNLFNFLQTQGSIVRNVAIINGTPGIFMLTFSAASDFIVDNCYLQFTAGSSTVQCKGINSQGSVGANYRGRIVNNILINTNTVFVAANQFYVAGNDISGWGVGAGIAFMPTPLPSPMCMAIGNKCHDSLTAIDPFGESPNGIENWSTDAVIANNQVWNCSGHGIAHGAANGLIVGNKCWDNNRLTPGGNWAGIGAFLAAGQGDSSGSTFIGNYSYDSGAGTQSYGFAIGNNGITNLLLEANRFSGTVADTFHLSFATYRNAIDYVPRTLFADPTTNLGAATKQYVDGRGAGNKLLYQSSTLVGNGADLTQDVLLAFTVPANTLLNVGDRLIVRASGNFASSADSKTIAIRWGGANICAMVANNLSTQVWKLECEILKTAANTQTHATLIVSNANVTGCQTSTTTRVDAATNVIDITGQNATNSVASSVTCRYFTVDYVAAA